MQKWNVFYVNIKLYKLQGVCIIIIIYKQSATRNVLCPSSDVWKDIHRSCLLCVYLQKQKKSPALLYVFKYPSM